MHEQIQAVFKGTLVDTLGIRFIEASKMRVIAEMEVKASLFTSNGPLHGGAIMALADTVGATGAFLSIPEGAAGTTTSSPRPISLAVSAKAWCGRRLCRFMSASGRRAGRPG